MRREVSPIKARRGFPTICGSPKTCHATKEAADKDGSSLIATKQGPCLAVVVVCVRECFMLELDVQRESRPSSLWAFFLQKSPNALNPQTLLKHIESTRRAAIMDGEVPQYTTPTTTPTTTVHAESNGHDDLHPSMHNHQDDAAMAEQDRLTMAQQEEIESQIAATQPLVGAPEPPSVLLPAYKDNPAKGFVAGVEDLARRYRMMRRVRGDGNCFYRAFLFAYLAGLVEGGVGEGGKRKKEWEMLAHTVKDSKGWLVEVGFEEVAIDMFWEVFVEEVRWGREFQAFNQSTINRSLTHALSSHPPSTLPPSLPPSIHSSIHPSSSWKSSPPKHSPTWRRRSTTLTAWRLTWSGTAVS